MIAQMTFDFGAILTWLISSGIGQTLIGVVVTFLLSRFNLGKSTLAGVAALLEAVAQVIRQLADKPSALQQAYAAMSAEEDSPHIHDMSQLPGLLCAGKCLAVKFQGLGTQEGNDAAKSIHTGLPQLVAHFDLEERYVED
jgi:hypothetical protein